MTSPGRAVHGYRLQTKRALLDPRSEEKCSDDEGQQREENNADENLKCSIHPRAQSPDRETNPSGAER